MSNDDRGWKPNGRPQSTIARNFSASLNDAFAMDNKLDGLVQSVEQKKQAVSSQSAELEALEAQLRETEERLKEKQSRTSSPPGRSAGGTDSPHRRQPLGNTFGAKDKERVQQTSAPSPLAAQAPSSGTVSSSTMSYWRSAAPEGSSDRPGNARDISTEQPSRQQDSRYSQ